jgi:hypothetical protein
LSTGFLLTSGSSKDEDEDDGTAPLGAIEGSGPGFSLSAGSGGFAPPPLHTGHFFGSWNPRRAKNSASLAGKMKSRFLQSLPLQVIFLSSNPEDVVVLLLLLVVKVDIVFIKFMIRQYHMTYLIMRRRQTICIQRKKMEGSSRRKIGSEFSACMQNLI